MDEISASVCVCVCVCVYIYICTQRDLCVALAHTEWKKVITMNTDSCVAFSSNAEKNDVGLCAF